jgi:hypothetical protein
MSEPPPETPGFFKMMKQGRYPWTRWVFVGLVMFPVWVALYMAGYRFEAMMVAFILIGAPIIAMLLLTPERFLRGVAPMFAPLIVGAAAAWFAPDRTVNTEF